MLLTKLCDQVLQVKSIVGEESHVEVDSDHTDYWADDILIITVVWYTQPTKDHKHSYRFVINEFNCYANEDVFFLRSLAALRESVYQINRSTVASIATNLTSPNC